MDELSADGTFADWSGHAVPLKRIGGSRRVLGHRGLGLEFDGTDRKVGAETEATANSWTSFGTEMSAAAWVYPHTFGVGGVKRTIVSSLKTTGGLLFNTGKLQFRTADGNINGPTSH